MEQESSLLESNQLDEPSGKMEHYFHPSSSAIIVDDHKSRRRRRTGSAENNSSQFRAHNATSYGKPRTHFRHPENEEPEKQRAQGFTGPATSGRITVPDVLEQLKFGKCFARYISQDDLNRNDVKIPRRRSAVKIACPGRNCNQNATYDWIC
jgi:hypothetical protein